MSRTRTRRPEGARKTPRDRKPSAAARRPVSRGVLAVAVAVALAIAAWFAFHRAAPAPVAATAADPAAGLAPRAALEEAMRLGQQGHNVASLPYFRRAVLAAPNAWELRLNLSTALSNAAVEGRVHMGRLDPALRSSAERIDAVLESEREIAAAEVNAPRPRDRAMVLVARAQTYLAWGLPVDALALMRAARAADPTWAELEATTRQIEQQLARGGSQP